MKITIIYRLTNKNKYSISKLYPLTGGLLVKNFEELITILSNNKNNKNNKYVIIYSYTSLYKSNVENEINIIKKYKNNYNDNNRNKIILIAGGPHPSGAPKQTINSSGFDYVICGEGEITLVNLLNKLKNNEEIENNILIGEKIDLNNYNSIDKKILTPVEITRGCPYNCRFCQTPQIFGKKVRHRTVNNILKLINKNSDFRAITPNALCYGSTTGTKPNIRKLELLLKSIKEQGNNRKIFFGTFPSEVRPEFITKQTIELIVKYCDNTQLHFGAQSGSNELLKYIKRGHTVENILNAVDLCNDYNIVPKVDFIFGFPNETEEHRELSFKLINYILKRNGKIHAHYFMPLVGTYFENYKPTKLDKKTLKILGKLAQKKLITGSWGYQMEKFKNSN